MNKPEWMEFDVADVPKSTGQCDDVYIGYEKGWSDALEHFLTHLQRNTCYTKFIPQKHGQRMISKRINISQEFVEMLLTQLRDCREVKHG
jgi:hypothetical protein